MARVRRVRCQECNELVQREDLSEVNGNLICPKCLSQYSECDDCGSLVKETLSTDEDTNVCIDCYENNYGYCSNCEGKYSLDNMVLFNTELWCEECYNDSIVTCEDCGREVLTEDAHDIGGTTYHWVCDDCCSDNHICEDCGNTSITLLDGLCEDCRSETYAVDSIIEGYCYRPEPKFFGEGDRFFGVELETEPFNDDGGDINMVREVKEYVAEWAYLKHDGSLYTDGFELVTHPMTLDHHIKKFTPELFSTIKSSNYVSHTNGNCGLHIHISRKAFNSELAIVKLLEFVYGNYEEVVKKLSRRRNIISYCRDNDMSHTPKSPHEILSYNRRDRYYAINTQNTDTIELRFFRGTLIRDTFISALQFADVLVNLANNITDIFQKIEWSDVYSEVDKLGYEELSKEMDKRLNKEELIGRGYQGYKIFNEIEAGTVKVTDEAIYPTNIIWSDYDVERYTPEVLNEFNDNYMNRINLDNENSPIVPIGTTVQIMPLTMMKIMENYGRNYPAPMREYAAMIYVVSAITERGSYKLGIKGSEYDFVWDRSSFRVLSEQELSDRGLA